MHFERQVIFWIAAFAVFVGLLWLLSPILLPFVLGMALAYVLDPLARRLAKRGIGRLAAASIILGGAVLTFIILALLIAPVLAAQLSGLIDHLPVYALRLQALVSDPSHPWLKSLVGDGLGGKSAADLVRQALGYLAAAAMSLWQQGRALISILGVIIITPVVAFYLLCDWDRMVGSVDHLVPLHQCDTVRRLGREIDATISAYVHGQSAVCLILGTYYAIALTAAGLSFGLLIGVFCGVLSFIPFLGSMTALIVSFGVAMAQFFPDWTRIMIVVALVLFGQFCDGNVLSPKLVGHSIGLHPVWLMFALFAFGYLFGFVGLLLAVPLAAATGVLTRFAIRRYRESQLYTGSQLS
jgi:predicted PurR-regulated permease PerM